MILRDFHVHTTCCDGRCTPEEVVLSAIEKGVKMLGIVSHCYTPFHVYGGLSPNSTDEFFDKITALKARFKDKIELLVGIEEDTYANSDTQKFDYIIASSHYFYSGDKYYPIDYKYEHIKSAIGEVFNGDGLLACEKYFEQVVAVVKRTNAQIVGHFDIVTKNNKDGSLFDENSPRYKSAWKKAVDEILAFNKDIYFEVNTGGISRGYKTYPYPSKEIVDYIKSKGGKFLLTSDAHHKDNLCFEFEKWAKEYNL